MLVTWAVIRNRTLKSLKCRGPKFHAIQIAAQTLKRFDQVSHDSICSRFRHCDALCLVSDVVASFGLRGGTRSCSQKIATAHTFEMRLAERSPQPRDAVSVPDFTSTTAA